MLFESILHIHPFHLPHQNPPTNATLQNVRLSAPGNRGPPRPSSRRLPGKLKRRVVNNTTSSVSSPQGELAAKRPEKNHGIKYCWNRWNPIPNQRLDGAETPINNGDIYHINWLAGFLPSTVWIVWVIHWGYPRQQKQWSLWRLKTDVLHKHEQIVFFHC